MATAESYVLELPSEVWIEILKTDVLDARDICNVSLVCRWLYEISNSNDVWKAKFNQCWPKQLSFTPAEGWRTMYKIRKQVHRTVEECIREVAASNYHNEYVSIEHFDNFLKATELHEQAFPFIVEDLFAILESPRHMRLTDKFFARQAIKFMQQHYLKGQWEAFFRRPEEQQHLETGARLVSWWMQAAKRPDQLDITRELDSIADRVRTVLRSSSHKAKVHPACNKDNSIEGFTESLWSGDQNRQVLKAVSKVLFEDMALKGNNDNYYEMENSLLEKVLVRKKGIPITLCILYHAVARRLGVVCEPVNFPNHFLLAFRDHKVPGSAEEVVYIDTYNKGGLLTTHECMTTLLTSRHYEECYFQPAKPHVVLERMARNLVCLLSSNERGEESVLLFQDALRLFLAVAPHDKQMVLLYAKLCIHLNLSLPEVKKLLGSLDLAAFEGGELLLQCERQIRYNAERVLQNKVKIRSPHPEVAFSVGMVMKHKRYHYTCVIYGWDEECKASREWIIQMGVHRLPGKQYQPFYNVLVEDGSNRYAAQENLLYTTEVKEITHYSVGRYFQEFTGRYYIPNDSKHIEYPDDRDVTRTLVDRFFTTQQ